MAEQLQFFADKIVNQREAKELLERLLVVAEPEVVFGDPVTQGEYTAITAREVTIGLGFGFAGAGGAGPTQAGEQAADAGVASDSGAGFGGGGGGGGGSAGRPVAVIEIGPNGVRVEPIVDPTKIAIAMFTALGSMAVMLAKMTRNAHDE